MGGAFEEHAVLPPYRQTFFVRLPLKTSLNSHIPPLGHAELPLKTQLFSLKIGPIGLIISPQWGVYGYKME